MDTMRIAGERVEGVTGADVGLLMLRLFAGPALALAHGIGKVPPTERFIALVRGDGGPSAHLFRVGRGLAEFVGGLLLAIGLLTRPAAFFIFVSILVAVSWSRRATPSSNGNCPSSTAPSRRTSS